MPTKKASTARRSTAAKSNGATIKVSVGGVKRTYKRSTCHTGKGAADSAANAIRSKGGTARVLKNGPSAFCVYKGPRKKKR